LFRLVILLSLAVVLMIVFDSEKITQPLKSAEDHSIVERESVVTKTIDSSFFPKDVNIVALGDSLTSGFGDQSGNNGYIAVLEQLLYRQRGIEDVSISNFAIGGLRSAQLVEDLNKNAIQESIARADYIIITVGGNDVMKVAQENIFQLTSEPFLKENRVFKKNINLMIHKIKFYNPKAQLFFVGIYNPFSTLFASVPEIDQIIQEWNHGTEEVLARYELTYFIPIFDVFKGKEDNYLFEDYIHPNETGYKQMASRILTYISHYDPTSTYVVAGTSEDY
jgi:lysophospholipase L1-like esterase